MDTRIALTTALALVGLALAGCAASAPSPTGASRPTALPPATATTDPTAAPTAGPTASAHDGGHRMTPAGGAPYDARFIDSMIAHHQSAIDMANQALKETQRPEIRQLAQAIITAQEAEIAQMRAWRAAWYPNLATTGGMEMEMGAMRIADDPGRPFDQRFIEAMIPHHEGAIAMAKDAQQNAEHPEIKELAAAIITAQEAEIAQMRQWQQAWFPKS